MKPDLQFNMNRAILNVNLIKVDVIHNKNGILINGGVSVKNQMIAVLAKRNPRICDCE